MSRLEDYLLQNQYNGISHPPSAAGDLRGGKTQDFNWRITHVSNIS